VQIGAAHAAGFHSQQKMARPGIGNREGLERQRTAGNRPGMVQNGSAHLLSD